MPSPISERYPAAHSLRACVGVRAALLAWISLHFFVAVSQLAETTQHLPFFQPGAPVHIHPFLDVINLNLAQRGLDAQHFAVKRVFDQLYLKPFAQRIL